MCALGTTAAFGRPKSLAQVSLRSQIDDSQSTARYSCSDCLGFGNLASTLAQLLETATSELERDREVAKASLVTASTLLQSELDRHSSAAPARGGLTSWQIVRVRAFIDSNLHRTFRIRDLSAIAQLSPAYFSREFKMAIGESPLAYVVRSRLERACHLMATSAVSLSEIALSVGFSDQSHMCRHFRAAFGQSPASWRREHGNLGRDKVSQCPEVR
jgi:AraC-like DNA-binding protein